MSTFIIILLFLALTYTTGNAWFLLGIFVAAVVYQYERDQRFKKEVEYHAVQEQCRKESEQNNKDFTGGF